MHPIKIYEVTQDGELVMIAASVILDQFFDNSIDWTNIDIQMQRSLSKSGMFRHMGGHFKIKEIGVLPNLQAGWMRVEFVKDN